MVFIVGLLDLHALYSNSAADCETLSNQAEFWSAAEQKVVEL